MLACLLHIPRRGIGGRRNRRLVAAVVLDLMGRSAHTQESI